MQSFNFGRVPPMRFGAGRLSELPSSVAGLADGGPVFVIADAILAELGVTDQVAADFAAAGMSCDVAAEVAGEPKEALIDTLCHRAREGHAAVIVGIGGGAAMDAAKLVAAIAPCGEPAARFVLAASPLPDTGLPAIAVPTTAGTGSEVTRTSVVSADDGTKNWFWGEELMFARVILDPELTVSLPPHLTAWTGIDAAAHALEGSTARRTSPAGALFGLEALRILRTFLPRAVADGRDMEARGQVLWASTVAGLSLHNCNTHMGHNVSHALGSLARIHHGHATGLALEAVLPWLVARPEGSELYANAAQALGAEAQADALPAAFADLMRACQIAPELPAVCGPVSAAALSAAMKSEANFGMAQNAACAVDDGAIDDMAKMVLAMPRAA